MGSWSDRISGLLKKRKKGSVSPPLITPHVRTQGEGGISKPGGEPSPEPDHAGTLIKDFQSPDLGENSFL